MRPWCVKACTRYIWVGQGRREGCKKREGKSKKAPQRKADKVPRGFVLASAASARKKLKLGRQLGPGARNGPPSLVWREHAAAKKTELSLVWREHAAASIVLKHGRMVRQTGMRKRRSRAG